MLQMSDTDSVSDNEVYSVSCEESSEENSEAELTLLFQDVFLLDLQCLIIL